MEQSQAKRIIEALLCSCDKPLTITQIKEVLEDIDVAQIKSLITELGNEYKDFGRSFGIQELAGGYQLSTRPEYAEWLKKFYSKSRKEKLSHPALETIAIIAYRQPITRQEIEDVRGVNVDGVIKTLLERSLIRITGRKEVAGRPFLYGTSREFLELFGLQSLQELPKLEEFGELARTSDLEIYKKEEPVQDVQTNQITQTD
ncbi:MAG: SMC-Scp complex subunit ScpB [Candidatus Omnitrophica bacterium]|nr:SMC-Scp complex subunit ScpB [Candidatus Omnitrophota bacterium]